MAVKYGRPDLTSLNILRIRWKSVIKTYKSPNVTKTFLTPSPTNRISYSTNSKANDTDSNGSLIWADHLDTSEAWYKCIHPRETIYHRIRKTVLNETTFYLENSCLLYSLFSSILSYGFKNYLEKKNLSKLPFAFIISTLLKNFLITLTTR